MGQITHFYSADLPVLTFAHLARAALLALKLRSSSVIFAALAGPPFLPPFWPIACINLLISARVNSSALDSICPVDRSTSACAAWFTSFGCFDVRNRFCIRKVCHVRQPSQNESSPLPGPIVGAERAIGCPPTL